MIDVTLIDHAPFSHDT